MGARNNVTYAIRDVTITFGVAPIYVLHPYTQCENSM
jgi:hypothetical protein